MDNTTSTREYKLIQIELPEFDFDAPLILTNDSTAHLMDVADWQSPSRFPAVLASFASNLRALVLPLELLAPGWNRQDLLGYELLNSLRWSSNASIRGCPVLAVAWQEMSEILVRKPDLLLVQPSIMFVRLPEAHQRIEGFSRAVQDRKLRPASGHEIEEAVAGGNNAAERISYHDLANEYYAAYRLWRGYGALLSRIEQPSVEALAERYSITNTSFGWEKSLLDRLNSPLIRRYLASRKGTKTPQYPAIANSLEIIAYHLEHGLPEGSRVLLVDDEFEKGFAEVLLRILFREQSFTKQLPDEWVYSESSPQNDLRRWARFVCVRNASLAQNWLAHWEQIEIENVRASPAWGPWLSRWANELDPGAAKHSSPFKDSDDILGANRGFVIDQKMAGPKIKSTVILLDLRLEPVTSELYTVRDLPAYHLRRSIKTEKPALPVVMFTASRQIHNSAAILDSSNEIDGWFVKEAPDIPVDPTDSNSANSVAYLLERLHLYSTLREWYRDSFAWSVERKLAYAKLFHSRHANLVFAEITNYSQSIFDELVTRGSSTEQTGETYLSYIQAHVPSEPFPIAPTLVARRVALAVLLWTADIKSGDPEWNVEAFARMLPGRPLKRQIKWIYDKLNFNQVLWMRSSDIISQLLPEELSWLMNLQWPEYKQQRIRESLRRAEQLTLHR